MLRSSPSVLVVRRCRINSDLYSRGRRCRRFVLHRILSSRIQLPASLCSTPVTALHGYYGRSDSCQGRLFVALGPMNTDRLPLTGLSASCTRTSDHSVPKHIMPSRHYHALPLGIPGRACHSARQASPFASRLATTSRRIEFDIRLRTGHSPPVALHTTSRSCSYFQLRAGERMPEEDFHLSDHVHLQTH